MANNQLREELILWTGQFDKKIDDVMKQINKLNRQGRDLGGGFETSMGKMIEKATGFNGSMGSLIGVVGRFAGGLGIAVGGLEVFNKTINSSQTLADDFGGIQKSVTTIVDDFFQSLANGDFSPFFNGIDGLIEKAREAYDAMDDLWNMAQSFSVKNARLNNQFNANLNEIKKLKGSNDPAGKKRLAELVKENEEIIKKQASGANKLYKQTIKGLQAEIAAGTGFSGATEGIITKVVESDIEDLKKNRARYKREYEEYQKELTKINKKYNKKLVGQGLLSRGAAAINPIKNLGLDRTREGLALQKKYGESIVANYLLQRKSDEELEKFNNELKQGLSYQQQSISNESRLIKYQKEGTKESKNTKGAKGNSKVQYPYGSVGWLDQEISKLKEKVKVSVDITEIRKLNQEIADLTRKRDNLEAGWTPKNISLKDMNLGKMSLTQAPKPLSRENNNLPNISAGNIYDFYNGKQASVDAIMKNFDMGLIGKEKAIELINAINEQLESLGLKPIELDVRLKGNTLQNTLSAINGVSNAMDSMGNMFKAVGDESTAAALQIMSSTADMVATVIPQVMALIGVKQGEALASGTASAAKLPFPANIAAIATIVGAIMSVFATIASVAQGSYANGGIVGGSSFAGDNLLARVNSGEMILNSSQQRNLFHLLDNGGALGGGGQVEFVLKGQDLYGSMKNYSRIKAMSGINTGIK